MTRLVKSPARKIARCFVCGVAVLVLGWGCVPRVNLPEPSHFSTQVAKEQGDRAYLSQLDGLYSKEQSAYWDRFSQCWGVKQVWGKVLYHVHVAQGQAPKCKILRMSLHFQSTSPTKGWKKLLSLQRDGLLTIRDTYQFTSQIVQERKILRRCTEECPFPLPTYQGSWRGPMRWMLARDRNALPPDQNMPPSPRNVPPTRVSSKQK
ncbi:MAG: hypothetical protein H6727_04000 [Myxococcales bacterium]|nr:hypothetical protein [Myxococcales bacterium]